MRGIHRRYRVAAIGVAAAMLMGACVGRAPETAGIQSGSVTFVTSLAEEERRGLAEILKTFEEQSGIRVNMVQMESQDVVGQLKAKMAAGRMDIDLVAQDNMRLRPLVRDGTVRDLGAYQDRIPATTIPALVPITQFEGKAYFFPYRPNVQIAFYNATKLSQHGLRPPETWDELLRVASALREREGVGKVAIQGAAGDPLTVTIFEFIKQAGGDPLDLGDAGSIQAFEFLQQLEPYLASEYRTAKFDTMNTILSNDTAYLGTNWPFGINIIVRDNGRNDIKAYHGWRGPVKESHVLGGEVLGIPTGAPNSDGALRLAEFLMSRETQSQLLTRLGWPPMRDDAYGNVPEWQREYFEAVREAMRHVDARPNVAYWEEASRAMNDAFREIVQNKQPVRPTLERYAQTLQQARRTAG